MEAKRTFRFIDANNIRWTIEAKYDVNNKSFSISGEGNGHYGQVVDSIKPINDHQKELKEIWKNWHLNNFKKKHLPKDFWKNFNKLVDHIENMEEKKKYHTQVTLKELNDEHLFTHDINRVAIGIYSNSKIEDLKNIEKLSNGYGNILYELYGEEYYCGTEEEFRKAIEEYIEDNLWAFDVDFLTAYTDNDNDDISDVIHKIQETLAESSNGAIKALVNWEVNKDRIVNDAIATDGYGHFLNGYDGTYEVYTIFGKIIYVCKA